LLQFLEHFSLPKTLPLQSDKPTDPGNPEPSLPNAKIPRTSEEAGAFSNLPNSNANRHLIAKNDPCCENLAEAHLVPILDHEQLTRGCNEAGRGERADHSFDYRFCVDRLGVQGFEVEKALEVWLVAFVEDRTAACLSANRRPGNQTTARSRKTIPVVRICRKPICSQFLTTSNSHGAAMRPDGANHGFDHRFCELRLGIQGFEVERALEARLDFQIFMRAVAFLENRQMAFSGSRRNRCIRKVLRGEASLHHNWGK